MSVGVFRQEIPVNKLWQNQKVRDAATVALIIVGLLGFKFLIDRPDGPPGGKVMVLEESRFNEDVLNAAGPVAVEFRSKYCPACKMFRGKFEDLSVRLDGKMKFYEVDVTEESGAASRYGVEALPTTLFFYEGQVVSTVRGNASKAELDRYAEAVIQRARERQASTMCIPNGS